MPRVARWFVFKPKIQIWVNFGGYCYGKSWYILWPFGLFYGHWKYFLWPFGIFCGNWYIFRRLGILDRGKSGNPGHAICRKFSLLGRIFNLLTWLRRDVIYRRPITLNLAPNFCWSLETWFKVFFDLKETSTPTHFLKCSFTRKHIKKTNTLHHGGIRSHGP
jgi:hypothetical protein